MKQVSEHFLKLHADPDKFKDCYCKELLAENEELKRLPMDAKAKQFHGNENKIKDDIK